MKSCLLIRGESGSGKTYTSIMLKNKLQVRLVHYDSAINFIAECIRLVFENKMEETSLIGSTLFFPSNSDLVNFRTDIHKLIDDNFENFKNIYEKSIKGTISNRYFKKYGGDKSKLIGLGNIGREMEKYAPQIFDLIAKHVIKNADFIIIEGYYFMFNPYLKSLKKHCDDLTILTCLYNKKNNQELYQYKNQKFSDISELEKQVLDDFGKFNHKSIPETDSSIIQRSREVIKKQGIKEFLRETKQKIKKREFSVVQVHQISDERKHTLSSNVKNPAKKEKKQYQVFSDEETGMSKSTIKLDKLGIPQNLEGKTVLDLGCNEGFFCFECEKRSAKVIGMDNEEYWIKKAVERRNKLSSFVCFVQDSWNRLQNLNYQFDLILFLSAFHYVNEHQLEILKKIYDRMNEGGLLILDLGLSEKNEGKFFIEKIKRPIGDTPQYPNKFTIKELLSQAGFKSIKIVGESHDMRDVVPRYVVHAIK